MGQLDSNFELPNLKLTLTTNIHIKVYFKQQVPFINWGDEVDWRFQPIFVYFM